MKLTGGIIIIIAFLSTLLGNEENIRRMNTPSIHSEAIRIVPHIVDFRDTIPGNTLLAHLDENGIPIKYSRNIVTGVCIDGTCRLVKINLFWDITGRYLGYELPKGEFLSKTEHEPFSPEEYDRLHELLGDSRSALATYTLKDLVPGTDTTEQSVDAVSSATVAAVLDYIVEGAVFTTHTLWHITYGSTKKEIEKITTQQLNAEIVLKILESEKLSDKIWGLNNISDKIVLTPMLQNKLIEFISGKDVYLAERSLNALKKEVLTGDMQQKLAIIFANSGFLQKRLILQKLNEANELNSGVVKYLSGDMQNLNGTLIKSALNLFKTHNVENEFVLEQVASLLENENRFIANQAYEFLNGTQNLDKKTLKSVLRYKKKNL